MVISLMLKMLSPQKLSVSNSTGKDLEQANDEEPAQGNVERQTWVFTSTPKKLGDRLQPSAGNPPRGWGLWFEEGTEVPVFFQWIGWFRLTACILGSLTFCVIVAFKKGYAIFGVGGYTIAVASLLVAVIRVKTG
jgi:hypothetical protein